MNRGLKAAVRFAAPAFAVVVVATLTVHGQESGPNPEGGTPASSENGGFTRMAIPTDIAASFRCVRADGETLVDLTEVASVVPDRIQGVMTFSVGVRDGRTHVIYLGGTTDCVLEVERRQ